MRRLSSYLRRTTSQDVANESLSSRGCGYDRRLIGSITVGKNDYTWSTAASFSRAPCQRSLQLPIN